MPEVVQTGASVAIDFLSGFGKGMVQNDINRREQEKHEVQKQKWQQEMTAFAAQDELRKIQIKNSRLEIDMRKTQFDDVVATREQTKGFIAFMTDSIGKAKGKPAEKQSLLLESYLQGSSQFPMADMSFGDKLIDMYSKIHTASAPKAWKIEDVKDYETGTKRRAIMDEFGGLIGWMPGQAKRDKSGKIIGYDIGEEQLDAVNETIAKGIEMHQKEFDDHLQAVMTGKSIVLGVDGQTLNLANLVASLEGKDKKTKAQITEDWIFNVRDRILEDIAESSGTLDVRLGRMLSSIVRNDDARDALVKPYGKQTYTADIERIIGKTALESKGEKLAAMSYELETMLPEYELPAVRLEIERMKNKIAVELMDRESTNVADIESGNMDQQVKTSKKQKEDNLLRQFVTGVEGLQLGPKVTATDWWANFLGMESGSEDQDKAEMLEDWNAMYKAW